MQPSEGINNLGLGLMRSKTRFDMRGSFHSRHKPKEKTNELKKTKNDSPEQNRKTPK